MKPTEIHHNARTKELRKRAESAKSKRLHDVLRQFAVLEIVVDARLAAQEDEAARG